jgi:1-deoxy-D-xylulose-5-phosphate synthase
MSRYLDMVDHPDHVKKLSVEQLAKLAEEIRQELITKLAVNGGHLGPNLGVVELTLALHQTFSTPKDKFIWDVSHQSYVHKLLTGRKDRFGTIRTTDGLCGFSLRSESAHDAYGAGHAGTALSAALGMAVARDMRGGDEHVVCIFGDAALTNGISFEALNNIAHATSRFIGILNDNEWSIAKNVGAIATYLNRLITHPRYDRFQKDFQKFLRRMPKGDIALLLAHKAEEGFKGALTEVGLQQSEAGMDADGRGGYGSSLIFEEMGLRYLGPIDGHDLPTLLNCLAFAKTCDKPIVLHLLTKKGKGYDAAVASPEKFHGTGPYDVRTGNTLPPKPGTPPSYHEVFGQAMVKLCQQDKTVVGITAAMPSGTGLKALEKALPNRYFDVGIAEEHAVIFAAGMASMGLRPVVAIYSTFLQRGYDAIVHDVALQDLPVIFCMDRAGLSANDGPTHHGLFDIAFLRCVPNVIGMAPSNEDELVDMLFTAARQPHPVCIRYPRGAGEGVLIKAEPKLLEIGKAEVVQNFSAPPPLRAGGGRKAAFLALGPMLAVAREAAAQLASESCDCAVINARFFKPLDAETTERFARHADVVVTLEDHVLMGGYGSAVFELLSQRHVHVPVVRIGWPDQFIEHATTVEHLREKYGLTAAHAVAQVKTEFALLRKADRPLVPAMA